MEAMEKQRTNRSLPTSDTEARMVKPDILRVPARGSAQPASRTHGPWTKPTMLCSRPLPSSRLKLAGDAAKTKENRGVWLEVPAVQLSWGPWAQSVGARPSAKGLSPRKHTEGQRGKNCPSLGQRTVCHAATTGPVGSASRASVPSRRPQQREPTGETRTARRTRPSPPDTRGTWQVTENQTNSGSRRAD